MIINDTHRIAFVHIPKCAGTTVRIALLPFDEHLDRFYRKAAATHPVFGMLDYAHIPLAVLEEHFPEDFAKLTTYCSFALIRDPFERFPSSLHERFMQRDRRQLDSRDTVEIAREIDKVLAQLSKQPKNTPVTDLGLIHFSRQCDYVFLNGRQIIEKLRTVAEFDDLLRDISRIVGQQIHSEEAKNRRILYRYPVLGGLQDSVTRPIEKLLPRWFWKPIYRPIKGALMMSGLIRYGGNTILELPNADDIKAFISEFYTDDIRLFERLEKERRMRSSDAEVN